MYQSDGKNNIKKAYNLDALHEKTEALKRKNPKLMEYDRQMEEDLKKEPASDEETRKAYEEILERKMSGEPGLQGSWGEIMLWLKEHPHSDYD